MLTKDPAFAKAKSVKNGEDQLPPEFARLNQFLNTEYSANLLNGDIYYEPIFKDFGPKLRLIIDSETYQTKLPIYHLARRPISQKFIDIHIELGLPLAPDISIESLNVDYIIFDEIAFDEATISVSDSEILSSLSDSSLMRVINHLGHFVFLFDNSKTLRNRRSIKYEKTILAAISGLYEAKGYYGRRIQKITIVLDVIDSLEQYSFYKNFG